MTGIDEPDAGRPVQVRTATGGAIGIGMQSEKLRAAGRVPGRIGPIDSDPGGERPLFDVAKNLSNDPVENSRAGGHGGRSGPVRARPSPGRVRSRGRPHSRR